MPATDPTNPPPQFVDVFETRFIVGAVRRHGVLVLVAVVIGVLMGAGFSLMSPPMYRAQAVLLVNIQSLKIGADGVPMDVEIVLPARRLVGTVCESDKAMSLLTKRLDGELFSEVGAGESERIAWLRSRLYYDQRGLEMAALRAVASEPEEAARLANEWALVSQALLRESYGTTTQDVREVEFLAAEAKLGVLKAKRLLDALPEDTAENVRLDRVDDLDKAQRLLSALNERWAQLQVRRDDSDQIAKISSPASPPAKSINPSSLLIEGLFGFAGLFIGLTIALLRGPAAPGI